MRALAGVVGDLLLSFLFNAAVVLTANPPSPQPPPRAGVTPPGRDQTVPSRVMSAVGGGCIGYLTAFLGGKLRAPHMDPKIIRSASQGSRI